MCLTGGGRGGGIAELYGTDEGPAEGKVVVLGLGSKRCGGTTAAWLGLFGLFATDNGGGGGAVAGECLIGLIPEDIEPGCE